ncbi:MAG: creatininase family protein [Caldilineaceae bacterium]
MYHATFGRVACGCESLGAATAQLWQELEHTGFPARSLSASTLLAVLHDIAQSVAEAGFRRLALINGHGGNSALLEVAARDIRAATGLMCFCLQPGLYVDPPFAITTDEKRLGFSCRRVETSLVLAIAPELVTMAKAVTHFADFPDSATDLFFFGMASTAWLSRDWSPSGVFVMPLGHRRKRAKP